MKWQNMKVLVTGAAGYIGGRMVAALRNADWVEAVAGADIRESARAVPGRTFYRGDIRDDMSGQRPTPYRKEPLAGQRRFYLRQKQKRDRGHC